MSSVLAEIEQWAGNLPYWEQAALAKVLSGKPLTDTDYQELLQALLEDNNLAEKADDREILHFQKEAFADRDKRKPILLKEISELENVNALVPNQRLPFGKQLTAIFGRNGSGKSGYARVLGSAGFTRGDQEILPNVIKSINENKLVKAVVKVEIDGKEKTVSHEVGKPCPELSSFYVFDSTSVKVHMKGKNTFSFSPAGLSVLTELSTVTDEVRNRLNAKIMGLEKPSNFTELFSGESALKEQIEDLDAETDIGYLKSLAQIDEQDEKRIYELEIEIGTIGLGQRKQEIEEKKRALDVLHKTHSWLFETQKRLRPTVISRSNQLVKDYQVLVDRAEELSAERFQHERFAQTGTELWHEFIKTAHRLALTEGEDNRLYPWDEDFCLLCQQPLSQDARKLILNLWAYLAGGVRNDLKQIESDIDRLRNDIDDAQKFTFSDDFVASKAFLNSTHSTLSQCVLRQVEAYSQLEKALVEALTSRKIMPPSNSAPKDCSPDLLSFIEQLENDISKLEEQDLVTRTKELEAERRLLNHRKKLKKLLPNIEEYVGQRVWARNASKTGGSTRHITREYNRIFEQLVKNNYISIFEETLNKLGRPIQVEIVTSGRKGNTLKQIQLKAHQTAKDIADPEKVLSEGEKRAVALSDFLTEAALDTTCGGIVMDDPVTSLDLEWRKAIAEILVEEANNRQVIVFTHDLPFLYLLLKHARDRKIQEKIHWIKRGDVNDRPGYVYIDNCPALEKEYKSSQLAQECYLRGKNATTPEAQSSSIRDGMAALRTSYEALVVYDYFGGVVERFEERISLGRLPSLVWDDEISNDIDANYGRLSRYIEGHLHSDTFAEPLSLRMLLDEIKTFDDLKKRIKELKKNKV